MDLSKVLIILNGDVKDEVCSYKYMGGFVEITFKNGYRYKYNSFKFACDRNYEMLPVAKYVVKSETKIHKKIKVILKFNGYYRLIFEDNTYKTYPLNKLVVEENMLLNKRVSTLFDYYKSISNQIGVTMDNGATFLNYQMNLVESLSRSSLLSKYLTGDMSNINIGVDNREITIFPFGSNYSQICAVTNALNNRISIVEGPPGTGKTQTILNIIANVVLRGQTVAIVSNNNSATDNVYEKLQKYGYNYIAAQLGSNQNKSTFIENLQQEIPDLSHGADLDGMIGNYKQDVNNLKIELIEMFELQNKIAKLKSTLADLKLEEEYFLEYFENNYIDKSIFRDDTKLHLKQIMKLWTEIQIIKDTNAKMGLFFKLKCFFIYKVKNWSDINVDIIPIIQKYFYTLKIAEIENDINSFEKKLINYKFNEKVKEMTNKSNALFNNNLYNKYFNKGRTIYNLNTIASSQKQFVKEYPVILSTTHSIKSTLKQVTYDYIIVDEASQVDLVTGVLALSSTKNIVVVGDLQQLPNVIEGSDREIITTFSKGNNVDEKYLFEENSLLSSIIKVFPNAPRILLKEHYRCHPKIIDFCNKKFYNNELIIMTEDKGEQDVLKVHVTNQGTHNRGNYNQRQIDEIKKVIIPELASNDLGIISPYRAQTSALNTDDMDNIAISTVHKFQGRENDDIIISTVDTVISKFVDNHNMLNVAVSRAKKRLRLVVSCNEENEKTNIGDLVKYIKYNNFEVIDSNIRSVFDYLYKEYEQRRKEYLKNYKRISEYDSENLFYSIIVEVLKVDKFSSLDVISHQPLKYVVKQCNNLTEVELKYLNNDLTHIDFIIYNKMDKQPLLAIEVDGFAYHKEGTMQQKRDMLKDEILRKNNLELIRFKTNGSMEKETLINKLSELV